MCLFRVYVFHDIRELFNSHVSVFSKFHDSDTMQRTHAYFLKEGSSVNVFIIIAIGSIIEHIINLYIQMSLNWMLFSKLFFKDGLLSYQISFKILKFFCSHFYHMLLMISLWLSLLDVKTTLIIATRTELFLFNLEFLFNIVLLFFFRCLLRRELKALIFYFIKFVLI